MKTALRNKKGQFIGNKIYKQYYCKCCKIKIFNKGKTMQKIAFISGSSRGIGKQIGIDLLDKGYYVYFNGHTQESTIQLEKELLGSSDANIICMDLSKIETNIALAKYMPNLDILILNLGITDRTPFGKVKPKEWNKVLETNLSGAFFLVQGLKDKINSNGRIIFISSISGIVPDSTSISYGVSKAAINMLVLYLAKEFAERKITVNAIAPGYIATTWHSSKSSKQLERIKNKHLLKRLGTPEEISKTVMAIINNDFITGQVIRVDGGFGLL